MTRAKSLLEVKDGLTFLDVIVAPGPRAARAHGRAAAARAHELVRHARRLARRAARATGRRGRRPADFVQNKVPKIRADDLTPGRVAGEPRAGVGAARATATSTRRSSRPGCSRRCSTRGYRYAFVSNSDNLGAVFEPRTLALARARGGPVPARGHRPHRGRQEGRPHRAPRARRRARAARGRADARRGRRRVPGHRRATASSTRTRCGSTCARSPATLEPRGGVLGLPMIVNRKTVDPADRSSPAVIQLETAMGAAIDVFDGARRCASRAGGSCRSRRRTTCSSCAPTPTCSTTRRGSRSPPAADAAPLVELDPDDFKLIDDFDAASPPGPPSLARGRAAEGARRRDVRAGVVVVGSGDEGPRRVEDGEVLSP